MLAALFAGHLSRDLIAIGRLEEAEELIGRYTALIDRTGENQHRSLLLLARAELEDARGLRHAVETVALARQVAQTQKAAMWLSMINRRFPE